MSFEVLLALGFAFGIGFGYFVQRAGFCIAVGLAEIYMGHGKRIAKLLALIFAITSVGFLLSGHFNPSLGLKPIGQIRGFGFYNLAAGMLFGAGILLNGGCILGTLRQIGEGNLTFVVVLLSFIPGMAIVVHVLDPLLVHGYHVQKPLLSGLLGAPASYVTLALAIAATAWLVRLHRRSTKGRRGASLSDTGTMDGGEGTSRERRAG